MRNPGGFAVVSDSAGRTVAEWDTFTCGHCNRIVRVRPRATPEQLGGVCRMCMKHTCPGCDARGVCTPFEKRLEAIEARARLLRAAEG